MVNIDEIKKFIHGYLTEGRVGEGELKVLALWHVRADASTSPVDYWGVEPTIDVSTLAFKISESVNRDAKAFGGTQQYLLAAYFGEARMEPGNYGARLPINVRSKPAFDDKFEDSPLAMSTEEANPRGFSAQAFRWAEGLSRIALPAIENMFERLQDELQQTRAHARQLEAEIQQWHKREQELLDKQHERNMQLRKAIFWEKQKEELGKAVMGLITFMAASYFGPKGNAVAGPDPLIKAFIDSIDPAQLPAVMGAFNQQQQMMLMQIFDRHLTSQDAEQKAENERQADMDRRMSEHADRPVDLLPKPPSTNPLEPIPDQFAGP